MLVVSGGDLAESVDLARSRWRVRLPTVADTEAFGARLGAVLGRGDLVVLSGQLGAGKTALTRGIAAGLGVRGPVTSPTFVIARVYQPADGGRGVPLVHVDAYRLGGLAELDDLDLDTDLVDAVVVVEWGEGVAERLADEYLLIRLDREDDPRPGQRADRRLARHGAGLDVPDMLDVPQVRVADGAWYGHGH